MEDQQVDATAREAKRRELAAAAKDHDEIHAKIKAVSLQIQKHDQERIAAMNRAKSEANALHKERAQLQARAAAAADAVSKLRAGWVPEDVRKAVSAAERAEREALAASARAEHDLTSARVNLEDAKKRVATVPSEASTGDLKRWIKEQEESVQPHEVRHAQSLEAVERAKSDAAAARAAYESAMAAARAL